MGMHRAMAAQRLGPLKGSSTVGCRDCTGVRGHGFTFWPSSWLLREVVCGPRQCEP